MPLSAAPQSENRLLAALSPKCYNRPFPALKLVSLHLGEILYHPMQAITNVYFPVRAAVSMVSILKNGSMVEVGLIGDEGVVGISLLSGDDMSPHQAIVQLADSAWRMKASAFKQEVESNGELNNLSRRYMQALFTQVAQTAACNRIHPIVERLARWLLLMQDRGGGSDTLHLTHEFIATMLGRAVPACPWRLANCRKPRSSAITGAKSRFSTARGWKTRVVSAIELSKMSTNDCLANPAAKEILEEGRGKVRRAQSSAEEN